MYNIYIYNYIYMSMYIYILFVDFTISVDLWIICDPCNKMISCSTALR